MQTADQDMFLERIYGGPPQHGIDRFFHEDLNRLTDGELRKERRRLQLRLLLTDPVERTRWPAVWLQGGLAYVEDLLQADTVAAGWQKATRR